MNPAVFYKSFNRIPPSSKLGNLGVTLNRIANALERQHNRDGAKGFVQEAMWFIEWSASSLESNQAIQFAELQRLLGDWRKDWDAIWNDPLKRAQVQYQTASWSTRILEMTNLLQSTPRQSKETT